MPNCEENSAYPTPCWSLPEPIVPEHPSARNADDAGVDFGTIGDGAKLRFPERLAWQGRPIVPTPPGLLAGSFVEHSRNWGISRITATPMPGNRFRSLVLAAAAQLACAASSTQTADIGYLASPGALPKAFPRFERPVADIVSPHRSTEEKRDANEEAQQLARLMGLKPGMVVGDIGAGSGYNVVRLSPVVGPSGAVVAVDVRRDYLTFLARRVKRLGPPHLR